MSSRCDRVLHQSGQLLKSTDIRTTSGLTTVNCVLNADFRGVSEDNFKQCARKDGSLYYEVHYNLNVRFDSAMMRFSSEMNGQEMGAVEAKY